MLITQTSNPIGDPRSSETMERPLIELIGVDFQQLTGPQRILRDLKMLIEDLEHEVPLGPSHFTFSALNGAARNMRQLELNGGC